MMELSENVSYMKMVHELKAAFPNMADELIHQCIKQHGNDRIACAGALRILEAHQLSMTHNHSYAPARVRTISENDNFFSRKPWQGKLISPDCSGSRYHENKARRRPSSILPLGITYKNVNNNNNHNHFSSDSVPKVVLTPESPKMPPTTLYDPEDSGLSLFGTTSTLTATCVDIDMESLSSKSSSSEGSSGSSTDPAFNVSRAVLSKSNLKILDMKGQSVVASTAFTTLTVSSTTSSLSSMPTMSNPPNFTLTSINPYRRIFEQRQQFYEHFSNGGDTNPQIKSRWQKMQGGQNDVFTVRTNIEPFGPFVIEHDVRANKKFVRSEAGSATPMICLNPDAPQDELRYATSHSGDGVESHLEVSLNKSGSIIKTRHQRLHNEENSVLKLLYGEGGKVLEIKQTQSVIVPKTTTSSHRPNSAYCTGGNLSGISGILVPRYNSMPNLDGRMQQFRRPSDLGFNTHPADEEKRLAYTRALISHQMDQRMKLKHRLHQSRGELQLVKRNVHSLEMLLEARTKFIQTGVVDVETANELEKDVSRLQHHCDEMASQVTQLTKGIAPLGETSIDFYESLPAVLCDNASPKPNQDRSRTAPTTPVSKKALPTNANDQASKRSIWNTTTGSTVLNATNNLQWSCTKCTFLNHPALSTCEECEMPRFNNSLNLPEEEVNDLDKSASNNCLCHAA